MSFALYIHWPFCETKCPYCDFNSHVRAAIDEARWRDAYLREMAFWAKKTANRSLTSLYFGGGTPSLMQPDTVFAIIAQAQKLWPHGDIEITLEANPSSIESARFAGFRQAGVNRVSIGVQSLHDDVLRFLERPHTAAQAKEAIDIAAKHFDRYSFDLIYGRPAQSLEQWQAELDEALPLTRGHLSAYQLTIEPGTGFATRAARGEFIMPDDDAQMRFMDHTIDACAAHGLGQYEVSNFASAGHESQHNLNYWRMRDYVGIGPGAHGRVSMDGAKFATVGHRAPESWLARVEQAGHGGHDFVMLTPAEIHEERLLMGLRLNDGIAISLLGANADSKINALAEAGYLDPMAPPDQIKLSRRGLHCLNAVTGFLLTINDGETDARLRAQDQKAIDGGRYD